MTPPYTTDPATSTGQRRHGPSSQRFWWGTTLVLVGVVWLLVALDVPVAWDLVLPIALLVIGVLVLLVGHTALGDGLVGLGILVSVAAVVVALVPGALSFTTGERHVVVGDPSDLPVERSLGAGRMTLDLRDVAVPEGSTQVPAGVTVGELVVLVPDDVTVRGAASVGIGEVAAFGRTSGGFGRTGVLDEPGADSGRVLELDLGVGIGRVEVSR